MSDQRIKIPRTCDRTVADAFTELGTKYSVPTFNVSALAFGSIGAVNLGVPPAGDWEILLSHDSYLITSLSMGVRGLTATYYRGGNYQPEGKSPVFDEIAFAEPRPGQLSNAEKLDIVAFLNGKLNAIEPDRIVTGSVADANSQLLAIHHGTLERLERLNEDLVRQSAQFREMLEKKHDEKIEIAEREFSERRDELQGEVEASAEQLALREKALEERLKAIDDRDNTHVRREIRDRMLNDVKARIEQFGVSPVTSGKRKPVMLGIALLGIFLTGLLIWTGYEIRILGNLSDGNRSIIYWLWFRFTLLSFGLVGTVMYYIKWQNKWAEQHASAEFQLQQFYIDVNRANWVIESCLEWRKETDSPIPQELLSSITDGLFLNNESHRDAVVNPADALASALMGTASKLKLRLGDNEMEFDKPGKVSNKEIKVGERQS